MRGQFVYPTQSHLASRFRSNLFRQVCRSRSEDSLRKNLNFFQQKAKKKSATLAFATGISFLFCCFNFGQREAGKGFKGTKMQRERQQEQVEHDESMEENVGPLPISKLEVTR